MKTDNNTTEVEIIEHLKNRGFDNSVIGVVKMPTYSTIGDPYATRNVNVTVASAMAEYIDSLKGQPTQRSEGATATLKSSDELVSVIYQSLEKILDHKILSTTKKLAVSELLKIINHITNSTPGTSDDTEEHI